MMRLSALKKYLEFIYKKGRRIFLLPFLFVMTFACATDPEEYGRVTLHSTSDKNSFIFSVSEDFVNSNSDSPADKKFFKMTQAEAKLLISLLEKKKYCLDSYGTPDIIIASRQEKIYDMTFAHLIEQSYKARPAVPRMYFGECVKK
jgi:hypothetical protein